MPIVRAYQCEDCFHRIEVTLSGDQWDEPPPACPVCSQRAMQQQFKPFAITGSASARAHGIAEEIATSDYHAADIQREHRPEGTPKVRYKDGPAAPQASSWGAATAAIESAIAIGRQNRLHHGSGLDVLQHNLKTGAEPDLLANSKRISPRIY